ncbi:MAG: 1-deoxy-D-xylulose-5-phosphate reductoisomerase [Parvibaculales bacterium]
MTERQTITVLGATGSIGDSTLDILAQHSDRYELVAATAMNNVEKLVNIARTFRPKFVAIGNEAHYSKLKAELADTAIEVGAGESGLLQAASMPVDRCMAAIVGFAGLAPTLMALQHAEYLMLANKECLVSAGDLFMSAALKHGCQVVPVDSEHNALYQLLHDQDVGNVEKFTLTASGGPFRDYTPEQLQTVTAEMAIKHPVWSMGDKISIDSATLMNKGLELIEAKHLFGLPAKTFEAVIHPQSIVHGLVHMQDGSVLAHLGEPDMRIPISYCLAYPSRLSSRAKRLDLTALGTLSFQKPDEERFACLRLAKAAMEQGGGATTALNAANEVAVLAFQRGELTFPGIPALIEAVGEVMPDSRQTDLETVYAVDAQSRAYAEEKLAQRSVF